MKKMAIDFKYLNQEMINAIAMIYKDGFRESDVISFSEVDKEMEGRVKLIIKDTIFFVKEELVKDVLDGRFDEDFLKPDIDEDNCDAEYC